MSVPVKLIGAMQWSGRWSDEITLFLGVHASGDSILHEEDRDYLTIRTSDGLQRVHRGDWLVRRLVEDAAGTRYSELSAGRDQEG